MRMTTTYQPPHIHLTYIYASKLILYHTQKFKKNVRLYAGNKQEKPTPSVFFKTIIEEQPTTKINSKDAGVLDNR